jgi:thermitase
MNKFFLLFLATITTCFGQTNSDRVNNQIILKMKDNAYNEKTIDLSRNKFGISTLDEFNKTNHIKKIEPIGNQKLTKTFLITFEENKNIEALCQQYNKLEGIAYTEPNYIAYSGGMENKANTLATFPNDTYFNRQWGLYNNGTLTGVGTITNDADVDMELAWDIETGDPNMIIAVPDSGLKMNHPEIASRLWVNTAEIANNGIDDDNNGLIDDINGWDWVNSDNDPTDDHGHGTNVIGIIGAIPNNNNLFTGANWNSKIMPLKVLNASNSGSYASMVNSIYYAVDNGAKVISFSIGGSSPSTTLENAISYTQTNNVSFVVCMMNFNNNTIYYPAGYSTTYNNVIAVGSTNPNDTRTAPFFWSTTSGSNYGAHINVVAPGNYIYGLSSSSNTSGSSYWGGTSQATPLVAGIASLLYAQNPSLTPQEVRNFIQTTAEDQKGLPAEDVAGFDVYHGWGRINAYRALNQVVLSNQGFDYSQEIRVINPIQNKKLEIFSKGSFSSNYKITIYSLQGKRIGNINTELVENENLIDFNYPSGIYILQIENENYKKIVKVISK